MLSILQHINRRARSAIAAMAFSTLACLTLLGVGGKAEAGYTCVDNITQVGNSVTIVVAATSGGAPTTRCLTLKGIGTSSANISISGSILTAQVGATNGTVRAEAVAEAQGLGPDFGFSCTPPSSGGTCSNSRLGNIDGVDLISCEVRGDDQIPIPDPALPVVPVVITATCTINY